MARRPTKRGPAPPAPRLEMDLERRARERREINRAGDARLARAMASGMSVQEQARATAARSLARAIERDLDGQLRDARERPNTQGAPGNGRVWVPGFYREVRGRRSWTRGYWRNE